VSYTRPLLETATRTMPTRLPGTTRTFLAGNTVSMLGTGLVLPFTLIYLHQVRSAGRRRPAGRFGGRRVMPDLRRCSSFPTKLEASAGPR